MKKYFLLVLLFLALMLFNKEVSAAEEYYNLLDMNQVAYNDSLDIFYSEQQITLAKDVSYTFVASSNFFGSVTENDLYALSNQKVGAIFKNLDDNEIDLSFNLSVGSTGLYYATITPTEECYVKFTDFLTKGYELDTLPKTEILLFKGEKEEFKGFCEIEYFDDYEKIDNTINIYTSYNNPISLDNLSSKIKSYDNMDGFNNTVTLVSNNYNNTSELGVYSVVYKTVDSANLESTLTVNVNVVDDTSPVISGPDVIEWDCYKNAPTPDIITKQYTAYDEIDGDLSSRIKVATGAVLGMYGIGETRDYKLVLNVVDSSGNIGTKDIVIKAADITSPVLSVTDLNINLSALGESVFDEFFDQVITEISDNSGTYEKTIEAKEAIGKMGFSGTYEITITVKDAAGNITEKAATIKIVDDIAPEFYLHTDLLTTSTTNTYSLEEIKEVISADLYEDGILYDSISLISCDYIGNEKNPGKYTVKYIYSYKGETNYMVGTIQVEEPEKDSYYWLFILLLIPVTVGAIYINNKRKNSY